VSKIKASELELRDKLVYVGRTAKVVKGGRRFNFSAIVVVGDGNGHVGYGLGKASEVVDAVTKATEAAKKNIFKVQLQGTTVPHEVIGKFGAAKVLIRPATPGTGVIAAGGVRAILELAGVQDVLTKVSVHLIRITPLKQLFVVCLLWKILRQLLLVVAYLSKKLCAVSRFVALV